MKRFVMLEDKIDKLGLCIRAWHVLNENGIETVNQLVGKTEEELVSLKGMGKLALRDIEERLNYHGLCLGMDIATLDLEVLGQKINNLSAAMTEVEIEYLKIVRKMKEEKNGNSK